MMLLFSLRHRLTHLGSYLIQRRLDQLKYALRLLETGFLVRQLQPKVGQVKRFAKKREALFDTVAQEVGDREVLYMEFGVYQGESMRYWSKILRNPGSKLHGFDSFEGLPEAWKDTKPKGHFSTNGAIPVIDDSRVEFFKGWFDQSLAKYQVPRHEVLVLNFDADLYSSTIFPLRHMQSFIVPGTWLYFDEFSWPDDELRAFIEFSTSSNLKFVLRGATKAYEQTLFQCIG